MKVLNVRNVQEGLPNGLQLLGKEGLRRESRNGPVLVIPCPVSTVYEKPCERVIFWPSRDANPFFHLYESLWMLAGRDDVAPLCRYAKNSANYSDDGVSQHGAYGHRWRKHFLHGYKDQLAIIATRLKEDPTDRRCVLQMWDVENDLWTNEEVPFVRPKVGKDFPCNTIATFQRGFAGELNLVVFCRSNDIVWGAYGANAVQFSTLLEYMALWIGCSVGTYTQISVNFHAYLDTFEQCKNIRPDWMRYSDNPYVDGTVHTVPMQGSREEIDAIIKEILQGADTDFRNGPFYPTENPWAQTVYCVLLAHQVYKSNTGIDKYVKALKVLGHADPKADWIVAAKEWIERRYLKFRMLAHEDHI